MSTLDQFFGTPQKFQEAIDDRLAEMRDAGYVDIKVSVDGDGKLLLTGDKVSPLDIKEQIVQEALKVVLGEIGEKTDKLTLIPIEQLSTLHQLCEQYQRMQPELIVNKEEEGEDDPRGYQHVPLRELGAVQVEYVYKGKMPPRNIDGYDDFSKTSK